MSKINVCQTSTLDREDELAQQLLTTLNRAQSLAVRNSLRKLLEDVQPTRIEFLSATLSDAAHIRATRFTETRAGERSGRLSSRATGGTA